MIGKAGTGKGFSGLQSYLTQDGRAEWTSTRNLFVPSLDYVPAMMRETAKLSRRVEEPVYHLSIALAPGESLTREGWEAVAERVLGKLGLEEHQALLVLHKDRDHEHLHLMINRVHPENARAWSAWKDWVIREQVHGPGFLLERGEKLDRTANLTTGERQERDRTGEAAFIEKIRTETRHHFRDAESWADLAARLHGYGLQFEARGRGLVVTDGERMVKASRIGRDTSRAPLEKRFGPFAEWRRDMDQVRQHLDREAQREDAGHQWQKVVTLANQADDRAERYRSQVRQFEKSGERLETLVRQVYRDDDAAQALQRLKTAARQDPEHAAKRLVESPEDFGRIRGQGFGPLATPARRKARSAVSDAADELRRFEQLRRDMHHHQPAARAAERRVPQLRSRARQLVEIQIQLRPEDRALRELGDLVRRHGERNLLALLGPAATPLRLARAAFQGSLGRTVVNMAAGRLLGPVAGPVFLIEQAAKLVRGLGRER
jgi:Relaxase/Mobilisation nuclease domain